MQHNKSYNKSCIHFLLVLMTVIFLVSCTSQKNTSTKNGDISWKKFYGENNGKLKNVTFLETVILPDQKTKQFDKVGAARLKEGKQFNIFKIADKQFSLINLDNQSALETVSKQSLISFSKAKSLRLYEFGSNILEVADFNSPNGVCNGFLSETGVNLSFSTNYYSQHNVFTTLFGASKISLKKGILSAEIINISSYSDTEKDQILEDKIKSQSKQIVKTDISKLGTFLTFLCKK